MHRTRVGCNPWALCLLLAVVVCGSVGAVEPAADNELLPLGDLVRANVELTTANQPDEFPESSVGDALLQMTYMDNIEDSKLVGTHLSLESLQATKGMPSRVLATTPKGPRMIAEAGKADPSMQPAVWKVLKGHSRTDCVALSPLNKPGFFLRIKQLMPDKPLPGCTKKGFAPCGTGFGGKPIEKVFGGVKHCCPKSPKREESSEDLGEADTDTAAAKSTDARLFNALFQPNNQGAKEGAVEQLLGQKKKVDTQKAKQDRLLAESVAGKAQAQDGTGRTITVIMSKNDGSLSFLKESTWCIRNPRAPSEKKGVKLAALENMGLRGFFLTRKDKDLVGMALGSDSANFKAITWQLADPKWELCPNNCMAHGQCKVTSGLSGKCVCNKGWANKDCSVLAGWPMINKANAGANKEIVQAIQALLALKGIPQDFDGAWSVKTELGLKFFLKANAKKGFKETDPVTAVVWEALIADVGPGWGKNPKGAKRNVVKAIQLLLNRRFEYKNKVGGLFDSKTEKDVKNFQQRFHLKKANGVVNINTWNKLVADLPSTVHMWPMEKKFQPFPDEQLYYVQSRNPEEYSNCRLYGTYAFSEDVPGRTNSTKKKATKAKPAAVHLEELGEDAAPPKAAPKTLGHQPLAKNDTGYMKSTNWLDLKGNTKVDTRSLDFQFKGVYRGGYLECNEMKGFDQGARALTVEMWFKPTTISQRAALFSDCDKKMNGFYLGYRGYYMRVSISAQSYLDAPVRFFEDTWHHVAGVFDGSGGGTGKLTLYLDGRKIGEKVIAENFIAWRGKKQRKPVIMGAFSGDLRYRHFWGKIDNVRVSRKALGASALLLQANEAAVMNPKTNFLIDSKDVQSKLAFAYSGKKGPSTWSKLVNATKCGNGEKQSPVNLPSPVPDATMAGGKHKALPASHLRYVEMAYHRTPVKTLYTGADYGMKLGNNAGELILNDEHFLAKNMKFHTPSEHTIGGMPAEMEMQIDHVEKTTGKRAIVSILFKKGRINHTLKPVFDQLPKTGPPTKDKSLGNFDLLDIIPYDPGFVVYHGSLTTPPCTEDVRWIVVDKPVTASAEQIRLIKRVVGDNARPQQNLNGRPVKRITMGAAMLSAQVLRNMMNSKMKEESELSELSELS